MRQQILQTALWIVVAYWAASCKPTVAGGESDVQTLDNLARSGGTALVDNSCGIRLTDNRYERLSATTKAKLEIIKAEDRRHFLAVAGTLTAVPKPIQSMFFAVGGTVVVTKEAASQCASVKLTAAEKTFAGENTAELDSCWKRQNDSVTVILPEDEDKIRHSLSRLFAYLYFEYFYDSIKKGQNKNLTASADRFEDQLTGLTTAFLKDIAGGDRDVFDKFVAMDQQSPATLQKFVFAETVDSYYCSKTTRDAMSKSFSSTHRSFQQGESTVANGKSLADDFGKAHFE